MGRGRATLQAKTEEEARPGSGHQAGAEPGHGPQSRSAVSIMQLRMIREKGIAEQEQEMGSGPGAGASDASPGKEGQYEGMKEDLELLKNQVVKLHKESVKDKEGLTKQTEKFAVFKEELGATVQILKNQVEKLQKEKDKELETTILNTELVIAQKLREIEVNLKAKKEKVSPPSPAPAPAPVGCFSEGPDQLWRGGGYTADRLGEEDSGGEKGEMKTKRIGIPKCLVGAIVGRGGQIIRRLEDESGAIIFVGWKVTEKDEKVVTITGTNQQIEKAEILVKQMKFHSGLDESHSAKVSSMPNFL